MGGDRSIYEIYSVINKIPNGMIATYGQKSLLIKEGITFEKDLVNLKKHKWKY